MLARFDCTANCPLPPQAETINRLLKKQSRPQAKNRRVTTTVSHAPTTAADTPAQGSDAEPGEEFEGDAEEEEESKNDPEMYRWISSATGLSFSIPVSVIPTPSRTDLDSRLESQSVHESRAGKSKTCDVESCREVRKYRLVRDWEKGACGMLHLKFLEGNLRV